MDKNKFFDNYFKILTLIFWPIIWYKMFFVPDNFIRSTLVVAFSVLSIFYIALFMIYLLSKNNFKNITLAYRVSTLIAFIFTLASFVLFERSITLLLAKMIFVSVYLYVSCLNLFKCKNEEGVVGIISSLLIFVLIFSSY